MPEDLDFEELRRQLSIISKISGEINTITEMIENYKESLLSREPGGLLGEEQFQHLSSLAQDVVEMIEEYLYSKKVPKEP